MSAGNATARQWCRLGSLNAPLSNESLRRRRARTETEADWQAVSVLLVEQKLVLPPDQREVRRAELKATAAAEVPAEQMVLDLAR
jgi:hypothetical protein